MWGEQHGQRANNDHQEQQREPPERDHHSYWNYFYNSSIHIIEVYLVIDINSDKLGTGESWYSIMEFSNSQTNIK